MTAVCRFITRSTFFFLGGMLIGFALLTRGMG